MKHGLVIGRYVTAFLPAKIPRFKCPLIEFIIIGVLPSRKDTLLFSAGSNYGFRPAIRDCVAKNLGEF